MYKKSHQSGYIFHKFNELNSQNNEKIVWSSSDSSDLENDFCNRTCVNRSTKTRKRKPKEKIPKNSSKLEVTVVDVIANDSIRKSPILNRNQRMKFPKTTQLAVKGSENKQSGTENPILSSPNIKLKNKLLMKDSNSPRNLHISFNNTYRRKSPVLEIRKKRSHIENHNLLTNFNNTLGEGTKSPILCLNKSEVDFNTKFNQNVKAGNFRNILGEILKENLENYNKLEKEENISRINEEFNSQKSHYSISESQSGESVNKLSAEIDSSSSSQKSQPIFKINTDTNIKFSIKDLNNQKMKQKYPKNGLAYRLKNLLKRKNSNVLLWRNELYLSKNSNFIKPKEEFSAFRIQEIDTKYGVYLLKTVNLDSDDNYLIVLNSSDVKDDLKNDTILKLYKPFDLLEWKLDGMQIIINALKYECMAVDLLNFDKRLSFQ